MPCVLLPYRYDDPEIMGEQLTYMELLYDYPAARPSEQEKRQQLLRAMFAEIGDNSVIGAGSVVTNSIPANRVALGVPCRVIREIGEKDKRYYFKDKELDVWD
ncbi:MAG: hypothetical protein LBC51_02705 [Treponema sp.]|jgi:hypothetical protein|nr:hypothetical protein [Treponema sp.]